jgi:uncharacterized cupredoxin-like copper-binding protein
MQHRSRVFVATLTLSLFSMASWGAGSHAGAHHDSAIGEPGKRSRVSRSVHIDMSDTMRFSPASVDAKQGETIRFVVKNSGRVKHEFVLGTAKELEAHNEVMKKHPDMEHAEPNMVALAPGKKGEVIWRFTQSGRVDFACLQPGHFNAGMKGGVNVASGKPHKHEASK